MGAFPIGALYSTNLRLDGVVASVAGHPITYGQVAAACRAHQGAWSKRAALKELVTHALLSRAAKQATAQGRFFPSIDQGRIAQAAFHQARMFQDPARAKAWQKQRAVAIYEAALVAQFKAYLTAQGHFSPKRVALWVAQRPAMKQKSYEVSTAIFVEAQKAAKLKAWLATAQKKWVVIYDPRCQDLFKAPGGSWGLAA